MKGRVINFSHLDAIFNQSDFEWDSTYIYKIMCGAYYIILYPMIKMLSG